MLRRWRSWQGKKIESLLSVGEKLEGGNFSGSRDAGAGGGEGMLGEVNRYFDGQKNVQKIVILRSGPLGQCEKNQKGRGAVLQNFSTHRIFQKVYL